MKYKVEIYREDGMGAWRWRLRSANRKILADGGEGYTRRREVIQAAARALRLPLHDRGTGAVTGKVEGPGYVTFYSFGSGGKIASALWVFKNSGVEYELKEVAR